MLAKGDDTFAVFVALGIGAVVLGGMVLFHLREWLFPRTIVGRIRRFFGRRLRGTLEVHQKSFPGYDLASVNLALQGFFQQRCARVHTLGSYEPNNLRNLLERDEAPAYQAQMKASAPAYQRVPVDVDREQSFPGNCLYCCILVGSGEKIALLLSTQTAPAEYDEDMEARSSPAATVNVMIGCAARTAADRFFEELEARRKASSVFRGKVIDPVVTGGGIKSIGFRRIHAVREQDLVLPGPVKALLRGAVVNFYNNHEQLRALGVEMKRGVLFHSPPGTGKTSISLYLAGLLPNFTVCFVSGRRLLYPRELCAMARYLQPTMLVFEDIDLIAQERDQNGLATVLGELMNQIDGCEPNEQVLFIMNTNSMSRIEDAVRNRPGRVDQIIHIPLPNIAEREELLRHFGRGLSLSDAVIRRTAEATDGATPALLKEVVKRAAVMAVTRASGEFCKPAAGDGAGEPAGDAAIEVTEGDLLLAVEQVQYQREHARPLGTRISDSVL